MFGTRIVAKQTAVVLAGVEPLQAVTDGRVVNDSAVPQGVSLPAGLFYTENAPYTSPAMGRNRRLSGQTVRLIVRVIDDGKTFTEIEDAAEAQLAALHGKTFDVVYRGDNYQLSFEAIDEFPLPLITVEGRSYRQLGTIYEVRISRSAA